MKKTEKEAPGVMIYFEDIRPMLDYLSKEQLGDLFTAIIDYGLGNDVPDFDGLLGMCFAFLKPKIKRDKEHYGEIVSKSKYAAYVRECKRKKLVPLLYDLWLEQGRGGESESSDDQWVDYDAYMQSDEWKSIREARLKKDNYRCHLCGGTDNLVVHHLTYDRLGREKLSDLITLCSACHEKQHAVLSTQRK